MLANPRAKTLTQSLGSHTTNRPTFMKPPLCDRQCAGGRTVGDKVDMVPVPLWEGRVRAVIDSIGAALEEGTWKGRGGGRAGSSGRRLSPATDPVQTVLDTPSASTLQPLLKQCLDSEFPKPCAGHMADI